MPVGPEIRGTPPSDNKHAKAGKFNHWRAHESEGPAATQARMHEITGGAQSATGAYGNNMAAACRRHGRKSRQAVRREDVENTMDLLQ
jgi:hypothetical protein